MAVDHFALLAWLAEREEAEPGVEISGSMLMMKAAHLNLNDQYAAAGVARAAGMLRGRKWIDWRYTAWGEQREPPPHLITDQDMQRVDGIVVTTEGHQILASRRPHQPMQQINITQSTVGQLALGDITNIDLLLILEAAERSLDEIEAPEAEKAEARSVLRRIRATVSEIAKTAAGAVLGEAVRHGLGI